ncbi:lycopene beta-cyclase [Pustulibacterium marinum]|uniref:Lycopene beta-cyclase n=1 Tax=Pustulibacterium marinum TaxID=1224947 RepID=A0A1I7I6A7_9FLAO|nr:lycopene cyclase family protein [Pustulibacterium marinum]SFU68480.1 lycopene beta-cyclase [Pustulibacterium marinum]
MKIYDYIICGGGAAGLQLAYAMATDSFFDDKQILIIEKHQKNTNDRTWCFWEKESNVLEEIVTKKWKQILFKDPSETLELPLTPYIYKMILSEDFYRLIHNTISTKSNIEFVLDTVFNIDETSSPVIVTTEKTSYASQKVFSSIFDLSELKNIQKPVLQQHFIGWFVETKEPVFNENTATFMDFSIPQKGNTRFMYVLPTSKTKALIEYTLFSEKLLPEIEYENAIKSYLDELGITSYHICEKEKGSIPMTAHNFYTKNTENVLNIGTAGGFTKASTGYTFKSSQRKISTIIQNLKEGKTNFSTYFKPDRFLWYDAILLEVLAKENEKGQTVFSEMFRKNDIEKILKFLDEKTTRPEELKIINSLPKMPFIKAFFRNLTT